MKRFIFDVIVFLTVSLMLFNSCGKEELVSITIKGVVVDEETGDPIPGVRVQFETEQFVVTERNGAFRLENMPVREIYTLSFHANGYSLIEESREASNMETIPFGEISLKTTSSLSDLKTIGFDGQTIYVLPADIGELMDGLQAKSSCENLTLYGFSDWILPNEDELNQMYIHHEMIGGFFKDWYLSSSSSLSPSAFLIFRVQNFYGGDQSYFYSDEKARCRCIRYK